MEVRRTSQSRIDLLVAAIGLSFSGMEGVETLIAPQHRGNVGTGHVQAAIDQPKTRASAELPTDQVFSRWRQLGQVLVNCPDWTALLHEWVSEKSHAGKCMAWEVNRATRGDMTLKLAAVKPAKAHVVPPKLPGIGTAWATSFQRDGIVDALETAGVSK